MYLQPVQGPGPVLAALGKPCAEAEWARWAGGSAADYADVAAMLEKCHLLAEAGYRPYYLYRQKNTLQNLENVGWCLLKLTEME